MKWLPFLTLLSRAQNRLLSKLGAARFFEHDILVGSPPKFQGCERDVVYLSMVASGGQTVAQVQNLHRQRFNVAMSRARDRCVLVRSIAAVDINNPEDVKRSIIDFFAQKGAGGGGGDKGEWVEEEVSKSDDPSSCYIS